MMRSHSLALAMLGLVAASPQRSPSPSPSPAPASGLQLPFALEQPDLTLQAIHRVNVTLGVMSRCPDAVYCETAFARVMERVNAKVALHMTYIGERNKSAEFGVSCKHGDLECAGNIHQLCVQHALSPSKAPDFDLSPSEAQRMWWNFLQCQDYAGIGKIGDEALAKQCLNVVGGPRWEEDGIKKCVQGSLGKKLLQESVKESKKEKIGTSCTIVIEGRSRCVRDGGQWKECDDGHETTDFVRAIEREYERKNPASNTTAPALPVAPQLPMLRKRQAPSFTQDLPPAQGSNFPQDGPGNNNNNNNNNNDSGNSTRTPLSVFLHLPSFLIFHPRTARLVRRQSSTGADPSVGPNLPTPFLAFAVTAIALFVLVVAFVLLRIFVRNRRLRRMGLLPTGPIDRLMGNVREVDDPLTPPKLWDAKIADLKTFKDDKNFGPGPGSPNSGWGGRAEQEKSAKPQGWAGLMPISAALPPSLYQALFPNDDSQQQEKKAPNTYPPAAVAGIDDSARNRFGLHLPRMLGRTEGNGAPTSGATANGMAAPQTPGVESTAVPDPMSARAASEPMPASVNVTVLIAMPSPSTVFAPSFKRAHATSPMTGVLRSPSSSATFAGAAPGKLDEADEEAGDDLPSVKGKARRAPSFRSVRSTRSAVADARREAFFGPEAGRVNPAEVAPALGIDDDEDEELPELVFGTASVPILASAPAGANPTQADLLGLVNLAKTTREAAARLETEAKPVTGQKTKETVGDETMTTADDHLRGAGQDLEAQRAGTGDVVGRVLREAEPHEALGRPSGSGWRTSSVLSSTDGLGLGFGGADRSGAPTPATADPLLGSRLSLSAASRYSAHVPPSTGADASLGNAPASASASAVAFEPALSFSSEGAGVPLEAPVEKKDGREEAEQFVIADPEDEVRAPSAPAPQQRTTAERVPNTTTAYPA